MEHNRVRIQKKPRHFPQLSLGHSNKSRFRDLNTGAHFSHDDICGRLSEVDAGKESKLKLSKLVFQLPNVAYNNLENR